MASSGRASEATGLRPGAGGKYVRLACLQDSYFCVGFLRRTPRPPPFSSMNSTPAASSAVRTATLLAAVSEVVSTVSSARRIVVSPTDDARARSSALQRINALAARICALVSEFLLAFFILYDMFHSIRIENDF